MYCHKKSNKEKTLFKKNKYDKEKEKESFVEWIVHDKTFLKDESLTSERKTINNKIEEMFIDVSGSTSHMVNYINNMNIL